MNLARISRVVQVARKDPLSLKYLALQASWSLMTPQARRLPLSWRLPADMLAETSIRWATPVPLPDAPWWENKFRLALAAHVPVLPASIPHPYPGILMFDVIFGDRSYRVAIDYRDIDDISVECATSVAVYFKLQFSNDGYPFDHIFPGGYVVKQQNFYRYLPRLRSLKDHNPIFDVYGRFSPRSELRRKVISLLENQSHFGFAGGVGISFYVQSLWETARARLVLDLPGYGSFCYRLPEYLAIGSCVIALPHSNCLPVPLVDRHHIAFTQPDGEDLIELCMHYLDDDAARESLVRNSRNYFDRYLDYRQLGAYYLSVLMERLGG